MSNRIQKRESNFTQVSNSFLRDSNISFKAKGLFCYMFSMSEDWNFTIRSIAKQQKDGEASIISSMSELKDAGYLVYTKHSNGSGTYFLDDEPIIENPNVENPNVGNPKLGKSTRIKNTQLDKNKKVKNTNTKKENILNLIAELENFSLNKSALNEWLEFKKFNYQEVGIKKLVSMLEKYTFTEQQEMVDASIMNNYKGLFAPKKQFQNNFQQETKQQRNRRIIDEVFAEQEASSRCDFDVEIIE